jgi:hypothetical protein
VPSALGGGTRESTRAADALASHLVACVPDGRRRRPGRQGELKGKGLRAREARRGESRHYK